MSRHGGAVRKKRREDEKSRREPALFGKRFARKMRKAERIRRGD